MRFENLVDEASEHLEPVSVPPAPRGTNPHTACRDCEETIPAKRRASIPNVDLCVECQQYAEWMVKKALLRGDGNE